MLSPKQAAQPNPSYPALCRQDTTSPWSTDYGGNSETLTTNASNKTYLKEIQEKRKEETFSSEKMKKKQGKRQKNCRKKRGKKGKEGPKLLLQPPPRWAQKLMFHIRTVKRNRNEIEAQKKSDFEHPTKKKKMKENENERK